ncbi:MAG TPA: queuosine precursor transporter [Azospirillaceae bacterium]|nr:queuosine precursor transporter [Azospirillaceae bacterium]
MSLSPADLISFLNALPPELLLLAQMLLCFSSVLLLARLFGAVGLYVYVVLGVIAANVEVLKAVQFGFYDHPVAMGTILFASTYLATDILTEHYGRAAARKGVFIGFTGYLLFTLLMMVTLGFRPMTAEQAGAEMAWALPMQDHLLALFTPAPALFAAGMIAYLTSQLFDVWVYQRIRGATGDRHLWLRNNGSTMLSALVDNVVFSVLAWHVFSPNPVDWQALLFTYILGTYLMRVVTALADTPFMYLSRKALAPHLGQRQDGLE